MAVTHVTYVVGTTPTLIFKAPQGIELARLYVTNHDNAAVHVGDITVSNTGPHWGFTIVKDGNYDFELRAGEELWAISATSANVTVLAFGV